MPDLLDALTPSPATWHEMLAVDGSVRPHWQALLAHLQRSGPQQLTQRQSLLNRQLRENGVTYNIYADPDGADRPWELDLLPQVIPAPVPKRISPALGNGWAWS